jgi:hypothetical protein
MPAIFSPWTERTNDELNAASQTTPTQWHKRQSGHAATMNEDVIKRIIKGTSTPKKFD